MPAKEFWGDGYAKGIVCTLTSCMLDCIKEVIVCGDQRLSPSSTKVKYLSLVAICNHDSDYKIVRAQVQANVQAMWKPQKVRQFRAMDFIDLPDGSGSVSWIVCGADTAGAAIVYATGDLMFNEMVTMYAKSKGMTFAQSSLKLGEVKLSTPTEESFFSELGIPFIPPEKRPGIQSIG